MKTARQVLAMGLLALATQAQAADWVADDITDILAKVKSIFTAVTGNITEAADDLVAQKGKRPQQLLDNVEDLLTWMDNRRTPFQDFVNGGAGRCGTGSTCATFRNDLRNFALQMAELKDRFPVLEQHGLGDTTFFADLVKIMPPFVLFGIHEILKRVPDWKDLPVDLADIFDEIGDDEMFSTTIEPSPRLAAAAIAGDMKAPQANTRIAASPGIGKASTPLDRFCSRGKEALIDNVRFNRLKSFVTRWKNRFDSYSEYGPDDATISLLGEGLGNVELPKKPFLKTISNALDSLHDMMETHRDNLEECAKIEEDIAECKPKVIYRTEVGVRKAFWVMQGVMARTSTKESAMDRFTASSRLSRARNSYNSSLWRDAYSEICAAYKAL
jgi:hypothetical protein